MRKYILILSLFISLQAAGQVIVQFVPEINGRNANSLFNCKIVNSFQPIVASLTITVSEREQGTVCIIKTPQFTIAPGANPIPLAAVQGASQQFSNNKLGNLTRLSRLFPAGDYDYCFSLSFLHSDNPPSEQCFSYTLAPFADLELLDPYDKDKICDKRPLLTWQPLIPGILGSYYQLVLVEVKKGQKPTEALNYNQAIINQSRIMSPILPYPAVIRDLEAKKTYAWQVTAYKDQTVLNRSDIWSFTIDCQDSVKKKVDDDGYRDIDDLARGNYYVVDDGHIKFALNNPYTAQELKYEITEINNPGRRFGKTPKLKLKSGMNLINLNLENNSSFIDGKFYLMKVWLPDGSTKSLRFVYEYVK